jgi:hypothetical protein
VENQGGGGAHFGVTIVSGWEGLDGRRIQLVCNLL